MVDRNIGRDKPSSPPIGDVTVAIDLIGEAVAEDGPNGPRITRAFLVEGLTGPEHERPILALRARGIPYLGQQHPSFPIPVVSRRAQIIQDSPSKARVTIEYGIAQIDSYSVVYAGSEFGQWSLDRQLPQISVLFTLRTIRTQFDYQGNPIEISYVNPETGEPETQIATVEQQVPMMIFRYMRREAADPQNKARQFGGKINQTPVFGDPAKTWLCTDISGESDDGGKTYNVRYEFQHNPRTWDVAVFPLGSDGNPLPGSQPTMVQLYEMIDFWDLDLTI